MADLRGEPTMEEILASIRRIISEDPAPTARSQSSRKAGVRPAAAAGEKAQQEPRSTGEPDTPAGSFEAHFEAAREELEIPVPAESVPESVAPREDEEVLELTDVADAADDPVILSAATANAAAERLQQFSDAVAQPGGGGITLEALVREMLRPMLKQWLDANLPDIVDQVVSREIARLTGKSR